MDDIITQINKSKKDSVNIKDLIEKNKKNSELIDVSIFDETLKEINQILNNLEQNSELERDGLKKISVLPQAESIISKNDPEKKKENIIKNNNLIKEIEDLEKNINSINEPILLSDEIKNETISEIEEHKIDKNLLSKEELDFFKKNDEKKKNTLGFFGYQILIIIFFFSFFGALKISKNLIISQYPKTEPYIQYFFEAFEMISVTIISFVDFIKNIILS
jgi:hypothetical protein